MPQNGTVADLIAGFQKKANLDEDSARNLRIYEAHSGKIYKELGDDFKITGLNEYVTLYAENIPEEEVNMEEGERTISAFSFDREPNKPHGVPFKFVVKPVSVPAAVDLQLLTPGRGKSSRRPRKGYRSGRGSRGSNLRRSSLPWFLDYCTRVRDISKMVSLAITSIYNC